jgi:hypothetical protein
MRRPSGDLKSASYLLSERRNDKMKAVESEENKLFQRG